MNSKYTKVTFNNGKDWIIVESGSNWKFPIHSETFAFDTETITLFDNQQLSENELFNCIKGLSENDIRKRTRCNVWSWQIYTEENGFFMTNNFNAFLVYIAKGNFNFGWCYNAKFDFSQIDYKLLTDDRWKEFDPNLKERNQPFTYSSLHNDMGNRFSYKIWIPYRNKNRHIYTHSVILKDFMNIFGGGLKNMLKDLNVTDSECNPVRKLEMDYQAVDPDNLTDSEIEYNCNDVKGLYFAIKQFNLEIENQTNNELHCFGSETNVTTAGGIAKHELLRSIYPNLTPKKRIKKYQAQHPLSVEEDSFLRQGNLYRGGICLLNEKFKNKLLTNVKMNRYDVNSEYPFAMSEIQDLIGRPLNISYEEFLEMDLEEIHKFEIIYEFENIFGKLKEGYIPVWFDPKIKDYVNVVDEDFQHLMFKDEFEEYCNYYDLDFSIKSVFLIKKGKKIYQDFVYFNYDIKNKAKKEGNNGRKAYAKLILNSSYGKLAERPERVKGRYALNSETNCVHFERFDVEIDEKSMLNVIIGSKVTSFARIWLLKHIREICKEEEMNKYFIYADTDSIHCLQDFKNADDYKLGGFKLEAVCEACKYLAPKTYIDIEKIESNNVKISDVEIHTKGVNVKSVANCFKAEMSVEEIDKIFSGNQKFKMLSAMNVVGGKVLLPVEKYLVLPNEKDIFVDGNNGILSEV